MIKLMFSYGLRPGSALILVAFISMTNSLSAICIDYLELIVGKSIETKPLESGAVEVGVEIFILLELIVHIVCLGYGVILRGIRPCLIVWIAVESVYLFLWEIQLIWFLIEEVSSGKTKMSLVILYLIIHTGIYYGYVINLAVQCLPSLAAAASITDLEPIGKGLRYILDHFKSNAKSAASLALMTEIMLNIYVFLEQHVTEYGLGFDFMDDEVDRSTALTIEDTFIRYIRVGVCIVGFFFTYKERQMWMFNWCLAYLITLTLSFGIFAYLIFMWRAVHSLLTLVYFTDFTLSLLYRTGVLYACVRYSDIFERQRGLPL